MVLVVGCGTAPRGGAGRTSTTTTAADATDAVTTQPSGTTPAEPTSIVNDPAVAGNAGASTASSVAPPKAIGGPGSLATRLLRPGESSRITLAALVQDGAAPQPGTLEHLQAVLEQASGKTVDERVVALGNGPASWSSTTIAAAVDAASPAASADAPVLSVLFVHGDYQGDTGVLGVATRGDAAAIFVDQLAGSTGLLGSVAPIERAVSTHEVGHLLGLVDLVLHTGRQDPGHPGHSTDKASVMYWAVESSLVGQVLGENPPTDFDAADKADLATIRSG